jgi:hypothetical protein
LSGRLLAALLATAAAPWVTAALATTWGPWRWFLPLIAPLAVYPEFARRVRDDDPIGAWRLGMLWAVALAIGVMSLTLALPEWAAAGVVNGTAYRDEMMGWIESGVGRENEWRAFLPQHALHLGVFLALTVVSGGYLGLALGAGLMAYMSFFVASFAAAAPQVLPALGAAWVPWSILRVMAFVLLGVLFARPVLHRSRDAPLFGRRERGLLLLALSGIVGDVVLKAIAAPRYSVLLRDLLGP